MVLDTVEAYVTEETQDLPAIEEDDTIDVTEPTADGENDEDLSSNRKLFSINYQL